MGIVSCLFTNTTVYRSNRLLGIIDVGERLGHELEGEGEEKEGKVEK